MKKIHLLKSCNPRTNWHELHDTHSLMISPPVPSFLFPLCPQKNRSRLFKFKTPVLGPWANSGLRRQLPKRRNVNLRFCSSHQPCRYGGWLRIIRQGRSSNGSRDNNSWLWIWVRLELLWRHQGRRGQALRRQDMRRDDGQDMAVLFCWGKDMRW